MQQSQQVIELADLLPERREQGQVSGNQAALTQQVGIGGSPGFDLNFHAAQLFSLQSNQLFDRMHLGKVGGTGDAGIYYIGGDGQVGSRT